MSVMKRVNGAPKMKSSTYTYEAIIQTGQVLKNVSSIDAEAENLHMEM